MKSSMSSLSSSSPSSSFRMCESLGTSSEAIDCGIILSWIVTISWRRIDTAAATVLDLTAGRMRRRASRPFKWLVVLAQRILVGFTRLLFWCLKLHYSK
jgi:hypothetical protein